MLTFEINWDIVAGRLARLPALRAHMTVDRLRKQADPSFGCNGFAWRLGTWHNETLLLRFDELVARAAALPNWNLERRILKDPSLHSFWTVTWALQVAEYLDGCGFRPEWQASGADLYLRGVNAFAECVALLGGGPLEHFLTEALAQIHPNLRVWVDPAAASPSSSRDGVRSAIDAIRVALTASLDDKIRRCEAESWPQIIYQTPHTRALTVYLLGHDHDRFDARALPMRPPDPELYLTTVLARAVAAKAGSNHLNHTRPNAVFANLLMLGEPELAAGDLRVLGRPVPEFDLPGSLDAACWAVVGIDAHLVAPDLHWTWARAGHPLHGAV